MLPGIRSRDEMKQKLTIGVALCTYNGERYLPAQLESIARQSRKPDLLLICDDKSEDKTNEILQAFSAKAEFPVSICRNEINLGNLRNFEKAISRCDTDIIVLSDQDDWWRPDKLQILEDRFHGDTRAGAVFSDAQIVGENLEDLGYTLLDAVMVNEAERRAALAGQLFPVLLRRNIVCGATMAIRGTWKQHVLPFPDDVVHDEWMSLVIAAHAAARFVPETLIRYRQHSANKIGLPVANWHRRVRRFMSPQAEAHTRRLALMENLQQHLVQTGAPSSALDEVRGKIEHMRRRLCWPQSSLSRVGSIARELISGQYSRYSFGWISAAQDLIRPMK